jgi:hypothetical protein
VDGSGILLFAIKFFAARKDFIDETDVYQNSPLRHFMPTLVKVVSNEDGSIRDPFGGVMAPFIVMEKGESLQERARNRSLDLFTVAQVCSVPYMPPTTDVCIERCGVGEVLSARCSAAKVVRDHCWHCSHAHAIAKPDKRCFPL